MQLQLALNRCESFIVRVRFYSQNKTTKGNDLALIVNQ
jgi:hypothetical protein